MNSQWKNALVWIDLEAKAFVQKYPGGTVEPHPDDTTITVVERAEKLPSTAEQGAAVRAILNRMQHAFPTLDHASLCYMFGTFVGALYASANFKKQLDDFQTQVEELNKILAERMSAHISRNAANKP